MSSDVILYKHPAAAAVEKQLELLSPQFAAVLGRTMDPARLIRTVMISLDRTPKLFETDRNTILMAAMSAACLGLEVDGVTGQAFILPFKGRAQLVTGYKGYNTLAGRGSFSIRGSVVREGDAFEYDKASAAVMHKPKLSASARIIGAWALAVSNALPPVLEVLSIDELLFVKDRAPGSRKPESPWNDPHIGFPAMCEKTAKRRLHRSMPLNLVPQFGYAARMDEAVEEQGVPAWIDPQRGVVVDAAPVESPLPARETGSSGVPELDQDAARTWPDLPVGLAVRVAKFVDFLRLARTVALLDARWKRPETVSLLKQVEIAHAASRERLADDYDKLRVELAQKEEADVD